MRGSRSRWSVSAITKSAVRMLAGRTSAAISSNSGTNSGGVSPANRPGSVGSNVSAARICRKPSTRARTSRSGSDPFQPA